MITGTGNKAWTAYYFIDTYHDGATSKHGILKYMTMEADSGIADPLMCCRKGSGTSFLTAREYFVSVMEASVKEAVEEWRSSAQGILSVVKQYVSDCHLTPDFIEGNDLKGND